MDSYPNPDTETKRKTVKKTLEKPFESVETGSDIL